MDLIQEYKTSKQFLDHGDENFQQYLDAFPYCVTGPAVSADSDGGSITSPGNSDASCCNAEIKQLEKQLLKLWEDKISPSCCQENTCKENEILRGKLTKLEEIDSRLKSTISTQLEIIVKQVEDKRKLKADLDFLLMPQVKEMQSPPAVSCTQMLVTTSSSARVELKSVEQEQMNLGVRQQVCG